eukprot:36023_1
MSTYYSLQFTHHLNKFRGNHTFESFCVEKDGLSAETISNRITKAIIDKLDSIIQMQVSLDVALSEIHALFCYATRDLYQLFPDFVVATSMGYHKFFFHFLMFGCLLGKLDRKHMALDRHKMNDNDYRSNDALRYCIDTFLANIGKSNMNYKYCDSRRINHECISHKSVSRESTKPFVNKKVQV